MAITQNPLIGATRKSAGNMTFSRTNGQNILRSKPVSVKNPRTKLQVDQRDSFSLSSKIIYALVGSGLIPKMNLYPTRVGKVFANEVKVKTKNVFKMDDGVLSIKAEEFSIGGNINLFPQINTVTVDFAGLSVDFNVFVHSNPLVTAQKCNLGLACFNTSKNTFSSGVIEDNDFDTQITSGLDLPSFTEVGDKLVVFAIATPTATDLNVSGKYANDWKTLPNMAMFADIIEVPA